MKTLPHSVGRFLSPGARGSYLRSVARQHRATIREISVRMGVTMKRVREVFNGGVVGYFTACEYLEGITGNTRLYSPTFAAKLAR